MTKLINPAPYGGVGIPFGYAKSPYSASHIHKGQDYTWKWASPTKSRRTVSPVPGKVTRVADGYSNGKTENDGWGNFIEITPNDSQDTVIRLCHYNKGTMKVKKGDTVKAGDYLGQMGMSGDVTGVHLHMEVWIKGVRVNPTPYFTKDLPGATSTASRYKTYQVAVSAVNLRAHAEKDAKILVVIPDKKLVKTATYKNGFEHVRVTLNNKVYYGYANTNFIIKRTQKTLAALNLRTSPSTKGKLVTTIPKGKNVTVLDSSNGRDNASWLQVKYGTKIGWVAAKYLK